MDLGNNERLMLRLMLSNPDEAWEMSKLLDGTGLTDQVHIAGAGEYLKQQGFLVVNETILTNITLGSEGNKSIEIGLLELRLWNYLLSMKNEDRTMKNLINSDFERYETGPGVGILKGLGVNIEDGIFTTPDDSLVTSKINDRVAFLNKINQENFNSGDLNKNMIKHFSSRKNLIQIEESIHRNWKLTDKGAKYDSRRLDVIELIGAITPEILQGDSWKNMKFKPFDVNAPAPTPAGGRPHPMQSLIERIRSVFLEMGFSEIEGDYVQSAGWNMDALFIPQSHPARTMQDTFYLSNPHKIEVDEKYLDLWANVHEHGHDTGSKGWGAEFDKEESKKALLRTHTTVNTVRHIANNPDLPSKVFGIGRVFRQETIDRTHLPEFHQIEGIIHEPNANLSMLISTLKTFYSKMGYPDVRVRPAYFPYTEPSVEVDILWRGEWLELGGAGIFRPEVTEPLGTEWPVCAWGMGLERLAMLILDLDDIRQLYQPDLERLQKMPLI
jgi:phenylalanyl-tRNA synthetase alpha chain